MRHSLDQLPKQVALSANSFSPSADVSPTLLHYVDPTRTQDGSYRVGYQTPRAHSFTVVCLCRTAAQALGEAGHLDEAQIAAHIARHIDQAHRMQVDA